MDNLIGVSSTTYVGHSFEDVVQSVSKVGYKHLELVSAPGINEHINPRPEVITKKDIKKISDYCNDYGVDIFALGGHCRLLKENDLDNFKKVLDLAENLGVKFVSTDTGEVEDREQEKNFYKVISKIADYADSKDISVCIEMHGHWFNTGKKGTAILKKINHPNLKINYDTGNVIFFNNTRPEDDIRYALPFLGFIHLKDSSGKYKDWDFPPIGEGDVDFNKIFNLIKDYKGPISVEIEFDGQVQPLEKINDALKKSMDYLKKYSFYNF
jgi:L-ribulose-5-phosphate 3-epimerase